MPLDDAGFAAAMTRFAPFERAPLLAVGVSGGADSAALVLLADRWARARGGAVRALIVDHGLRPGSTDEARRVRRRLTRRGIAAEVLTAWPDQGGAAPPRTRIQERCRERRLALLVDAAAAAGALHLLLGHHADDQAETLAMRAARGDPGDGAAGIPAVRELPALRVLRPLLGVSRAMLEATCRARRWSPLQDPSNADPRFERVRIRGQRRGLDPGGDRAVMADATAAARARAAAERALAAWLAAHASVDPGGSVALDRGAWQAAEAPLRRRILRAALACVSGRVHPPRGRSLDGAVAALAVAGRVVRTLQGCLLVARRNVIEVRPEPCAAAPAASPARFDAPRGAPTGVLRAQAISEYVIEACPACPARADGPALEPAAAALAPARPLAPPPFAAIVLA